MGKILRHFNRNKLPDHGFMKNLLERTFGVDRTQSDELTGLLVANAKYCGILQEISGAQYIRIDHPVHSDPNVAPDVNDDAGVETPIVDFNAVRERQEPPTVPASRRDAGKIFVGHGKKLKPVEGLKKVLDQFQIAYTVAIDEPHGGRPISAKVAQLINAAPESSSSPGMNGFSEKDPMASMKKSGDPARTLSMNSVRPASFGSAASSS
jgi:hypothetical protein